MKLRRRRRRRPLKSLWPGVAEGYATNQVHAQLWRMHGRETFEDMMQEAFLVYARVHARYATKTNDPKWLMALFREALQNRLTDLARRNGLRARCELVTDAVDISTERSDPIDAIDELIEAVDNAPQELRSVLLVLLKAPDEIVEEVQKCARRSARRASRFMCLLTGQSEDTDLWDRAREYLKRSLQ
jgi:hypothetical protein